MTRTARALVFSSAALAACAGSAADKSPGQPASFVVAPGEELDIRLAANPSTGFQWRIGDPLDEAVVVLVGSDFQRTDAVAPTDGEGAPAPGSESAAPLGQGGFETWRFRAVAPGRTTIELVYVRPWEENAAPARFAIYSVDVR
jgi:inhibitor of cysteine peptidase